MGLIVVSLDPEANAQVEERPGMVGLEARSSGPVRLSRDRQSYLADGFDNLYPIGEGAGYAGGIMSAAIDGARAAQRCLVG